MNRTGKKSGNTIAGSAPTGWLRRGIGRAFGSLIGVVAIGCGTANGPTVGATSSGPSGAGGHHAAGGTSGVGGQQGTGGAGGGSCAAGAAQACYAGSPATKGVGACKAGAEICAQGQWSACEGEVTPIPEACNGVDDDCNGTVDDGIPKVKCGKGACEVTVAGCKGGKAVPCVPLAPGPVELCNGIDDNCDGVVDEGCDCVDGAKQPCYTGSPGTQHVGLCADGSQLCANGKWGACSGEVTPLAEVCDGKDNDCDGVVDDGIALKTCGIGACAASVPGCANGAPVPCVPGTPHPETCNGKDDNCDGVIDDGNPGGGAACSDGLKGPCALGTVTCSAGQFVCAPSVAPTPEICDGKDNDCDGVIDNGNPGGGGTCPTGKPGVCAAGVGVCVGGSVICAQTVQPSAELCDGLDNNCNSLIDEANPGGGVACGTGKPGACAAGATACSAGQLICAPNLASQPESCDGKDNNCDGQIDEGNPGGGVACGTGKLGVCGAGVTACSGGQVICLQTAQPSPEVCDGKDNDCNGVADNGNPGGGAGCATGLPGVCSAGTTSCSGGALACVETTFPSAELCDGLDNNCNGAADEGNPGGGQLCNTGKLGVCAAGTMTCSGGSFGCLQNTQPSVEVCDAKDNDCNGAVDDGNPGAGKLCNTGKLGVCAGGTTGACVNGVQACAQNVQPSAELCDQLDNNCNGQVDEGNPGGGAACGTGKLGVCAAGTVTCSAGALICAQNVQSSAEVCDNKDNDCNGVADEGNPGTGQACSTGSLGVCAAGTKGTCSGGVQACKESVQPSPESCDGLDNDCNGLIDDSSACLWWVSGVQQNVAPATMTGWTQCFSDTYADASPTIATVLGQCNKAKLLLACRPVGAANWSLAAMGPATDVTFDVGTGNTTHTANGVGWYFNPGSGSAYSSWGFVPQGDVVSRTACDTVGSTAFPGGVDGNLRLCWHTSNASLAGGWRCGVTDTLNADATWQRGIFQAN